MCKLLKKLFCLLSYLFQIVQNHPDSFVRVYFHYRHIIEYRAVFLHALPYAILQCAQGDSQVEAVLDKTFPCRVQCKIMPYTYFKSQVLHFPCQSIITAHISSVFAENKFPSLFIHILHDKRHSFIGNCETHHGISLFGVSGLSPYLVHLVSILEIIIQHVNQIHTRKIVCQHEDITHYHHVMFLHIKIS